MVVADSTMGDNCVDWSSENVNQVVAESSMGDDCVYESPGSNSLTSSNGVHVQSLRDMSGQGIDEMVTGR